MTYLKTIQYLESFINYEKIPEYPYRESLKLRRIHDFLAMVNNPQDSLRCIHVAGSKGKGSTSAFITYILREAGYRVGLYTSPHLSDFRERIRILNRKVSRHPFEGMISEADLARLITGLKPAIEKYNRISKYGPLSFFEVYTTLAFIYFKEKKVDFAVLETGLGGRLDATNTVNPLVCVITPISYEHTQKLGNTLQEIAAEKAGIIKRQKFSACMQAEKGQRQKLVVISAPQTKEAAGVIKQKCKQAGAQLCIVGKDINCKTTKEGFKVEGVFGEYDNLKIKLIGRHQLVNAATALAAVRALYFHDVNIGVAAIRRGLYNTIWPARCEVISRDPLLVIDGAQNVASSRVLRQAIKDNFKFRKLILILGISQDKDIQGICKEFYSLADQVILTRADNPRAAEPALLSGYFRGKDVYLTRNVKDSLCLAGKKAGKEDLILVTGSLFVVGEARGMFL